MTKPVTKSKTLWFNALTLAAIAADAILQANTISNPKVIGWILVGSALVNGYLRMITNAPVSLKP